MSTIDTFTGKKIDPFNPDPDCIVIEDIAHALGMLCRFGGHCTEFYSVAEHSVHVSNLVPIGFELWGLLHDATEAYIGDVVRPIKHTSDMDAYRSAEARLNRAIAGKFGIPVIVPPEIKAVDTKMLAIEKSQILPGANIPPILGDPSVNMLRLLNPKEAEHFFLERFYELTS